MYLALNDIKDRPVLNKTRGGVFEICRMSLDRESISYLKGYGGLGGGVGAMTLVSA